MHLFLYFLTVSSVKCACVGRKMLKIAQQKLSIQRKVSIFNYEFMIYTQPIPHKRGKQNR